MAIDTHKYADRVEYKTRHSALEEFGRDERKPAVLLLSALLLSALFFGLGLLVGRWTAQPNVAAVAPSSSPATQATPAPSPQPAAAPAATAPSPAPSPSAARRFSVLVATYDTPEKTQSLVKSLQEAGYTDIRTTSPRAGAQRPSYSVLVGRFTQDEAREAVKRMRGTNDARLKNAKVIESSGQ
ncbi:MAG TPA: SPOR domain-containing protein [Pyrinomonadaceae bacterium]|nr:SPOR domain-containing protein [Pyrinomonadaceae bacterium]